MSQLQKIKEKYAEYIEGLEWSYFFTLTTAYDMTLKSARRLAERWYNKFKNVETRLFWCGEKFECKDGYHIHGLLFMPSKEDLTLFKELEKYRNERMLEKHWHTVSGGKNRCEIRKYKKMGGAGGYCSKYVFKDEADYDLLT